MDVTGQVRETIARYGIFPHSCRVLVGVSGGSDSLCLLHVLRCLEAEYGLSLHVAHMDHGIRGEGSRADARFVRETAEKWDLPVTIECCDVPRLVADLKLSVEEAARQARYAFFARLAGEIGAQAIAVGHNADDQTETVLMHWLRGSGLAGLSGMRPRAPMGGIGPADADARDEGESGGQLQLVRPLLEVPREAIDAYCREHDLRPRFDGTNLDTTYFRNRLRHELIPYLETYNPNIREVIRRSAAIISDEHVFLRVALEDAWAQVVLASSDQVIEFDLAAWRRLPVNLQRSTLREAIHRLRRGLRDISWVHVENAVDVARTRTTGAEATLPQGLALRLGYARFVVSSAGFEADPGDVPLLNVRELPLEIPGVTALPGSSWELESRLLPRAGAPPEFAENPNRLQAFLDADVAGSDLALRVRKPGDRFQPLGMGRHFKMVGDWMTNAKVPLAFRDRVPLLASPSMILWISGGQIDERAKVSPETRRVLHLLFVRR